jgi:hypothetical protein
VCEQVSRPAKPCALPATSRRVATVIFSIRQRYGKPTVQHQRRPLSSTISRSGDIRKSLLTALRDPIIRCGRFPGLLAAFVEPLSLRLPTARRSCMWERMSMLMTLRHMGELYAYGNAVQKYSRTFPIRQSIMLNGEYVIPNNLTQFRRRY